MSILTSHQIGERMREFRKRRGLTQEQLAEIVDVTFQQIQKYENGTNKMNTDKIQSVAQALSVPVAAFFDDDRGDERLLSEQEQNLIEGFRTISNYDVRDFLVKRLLKPHLPNKVE